MAKDYKLCPKCNNALDNKETKCPYCGENFWYKFSIGDESITNQRTSNKVTSAKTSGCMFIIIIFIAIQIIGVIISFISRMISSIF